MNPLSVSLERRQRGAETVEFVLTLLFFLFVFFMILEFAVLTYDRGTVNNAARDASRRASLYWVDPAQFNPTTPLSNQRINPNTVRDFVQWTEDNLVIDPASSGLTRTLSVGTDSIDISPSTGGLADVVVRPNEAVILDIDYAHQYLWLSGFVPSTGLGLNTDSGASVE